MTVIKQKNLEISLDGITTSLVLLRRFTHLIRVHEESWLSNR